MDSSKIPDSRAATESPAPAKRFPQWREVEQDFWIDMFEHFSEIVLEHVPQEDSDLEVAIQRSGGAEEFYRSKVRIAAVLADEATVEMLYRFERQKPVSQQRRINDHSDGPDRNRAKRRTYRR